jgi:hypothetical protein
MRSKRCVAHLSRDQEHRARRRSVTTRLATFLQEVRRSLDAQSQIFGAPDRNGLRVLEATDVRGLRIRAVSLPD